MEESNVEMFRKEELERLENQMKEISKWVEPDILNMGDEEIKEMSIRITHQSKSNLAGLSPCLLWVAPEGYRLGLKE